MTIFEQMKIEQLRGLIDQLIWVRTVYLKKDYRIGGILQDIYEEHGTWWIRIMDGGSHTNCIDIREIITIENWGQGIGAITDSIR